LVIYIKTRESLSKLFNELKEHNRNAEDVIVTTVPTYRFFDEGHEPITFGLQRLRVSHHSAVAVKTKHNYFQMSTGVMICH
jgi:hypothetical protein